MAWRLKMKARKAPKGMELVRERLEEFENETREALNTPADDKRRNEITWPMHKLHYKKNRYLYDMHFKEHKISKQLLDYLMHEKIADGKLISKWKRTGYETVCSLAVITKSNTNYKSVGICRVPLRQRKGQILPNVLTGCVSCASGDNGPIWWDDPIPDIVKQRVAEVDPGKADLVVMKNNDDDDNNEQEQEREEESEKQDEREVNNRISDVKHSNEDKDDQGNISNDEDIQR